jgi:hypothetical protein
MGQRILEFIGGSFQKKTSLNQALVVSIMDKFLLIMEHMQIKKTFVSESLAQKCRKAKLVT